jgi:hypothetical protein
MGLSLVTRTEFKSYAGITSPTQDAIIDTLIPKISALVKTLCRRTFVDYVNDSKIEYFDGGYSEYSTEETPVLSVSSLEASLDYGNTYISLEEYTDYAVSKITGNIKAISSLGFPEAVNGYKVTYTAGYETLPEDLKLAIFDLITYYMKNDGAIHSNKAPGGNSVQIEYVTNTNLPAYIKRVLDQYTANYS